MLNLLNLGYKLASIKTPLKAWKTPPIAFTNAIFEGFPKELLNHPAPLKISEANKYLKTVSKLSSNSTEKCTAMTSSSMRKF